MDNLKEKLLSLGMFIDNNYLDFYCYLIYNNMQTQQKKTITEKHHIIPRSWFKLNNTSIDNSKDNIVNLTHFDHCLAHYYLCLCTEDQLKYKNEHAFIRMTKTDVRFADFDFNTFLTSVDYYDNIYKDFCAHQAELNKQAYIKRGGGTLKGRKCWTDGNKIIYAEECPEGFYPGCTNNKLRKAETKEKMHFAAVERSKDINYRKKLSDSLKGRPGNALNKMWINNTISEKYISKDATIPEGWSRGRLPFSEHLKKLRSEQQKKSIWITNNIEQKIIFDIENIPDGWHRGRLPTSKETAEKIRKAHLEKRKDN